MRDTFPYGLWRCTDGREVLFNRRYTPILQRYPGQPATPLGPAPWWMTDPQREAWEAFRVEAPWLRQAHAALLEIAAIARAKLTDGEASTSMMGLLRQCLGQMGLPR